MAIRDAVLRAGMLLALVTVGVPAGAGEGERGPPDATQVVVRGRSQLVDALEVACRPAWDRTAAPRPLALIVDVTPNTADDAPALRAAFAQLLDRGHRAASYSLAPLGGRFAKPRAALGALSQDVEKTLAKETPVVSTMGALRKTLKTLKGEAPVVVYLADWHFEDEAGLEALLKDLRRKKATFSVIGTEAAFDRGWNDGIKSGSEFAPDSIRGIDLEWHFEGIGRSPFGRLKHDAPWHGGETAYPMVPYRWSWLLWDTAFSAHDWETADLDGEGDESELEEVPEDLRRRLPPEVARRLGEELGRDRPDGGGEPPPDPFAGLSAEERNIQYPLPSAFGPYGLMRLAGETGGRYVLHSFNPKGRRRVKYDYARCNLFPPDLTPRADLLKGLRRNPYARAMIDAWNELVVAQGGIVQIQAPLKAGARSPRSIDYIPSSGGISHAWDHKGEYKAFLRAAAQGLEILDGAAARLDEVLLRQVPPPPGPMRRYEAAARYFRHVVRVVRFEVAEALTAARDLPPDAWKRKGESPGLGTRTWIRQGRDPERVRLVRGMEPFDAQAGQVVLAERKALLRRFQGTPFGEQLALNDVETCRPSWWQEATEVPRDGRSPTESKDDRPATPKVPGGPSGGGGPTTGK